MDLTCEEVKQQITWFLDDEMDAEQYLLLERHLEGCTDCRKVIEHESDLRETLWRAGHTVHAPPQLRSHIHEVVSSHSRSRSIWNRAWPVAAALVILSSLVWRGTAGGGQDLEHLTSRHARNLPMDVSAGEWTKVQTYLNARLPFAVKSPRFHRTAGMNLVGGRVTQVGDREAAYVRFRNSAGQVSMFVYEDAGGFVPEIDPMYRAGHRRIMMRRMHGFTIALWRDGGLVYSVVSDLPEQQFRSVLFVAP